jgi:uncharacterized protein (DUF58 family)
VTRGAGTAFLGGALALSAFLFAIPALYVPGIALLALGAVAAPWTHLAARNTTVRCTTGRAALIEGEVLEITIAADLGRWPLPGGELVGPGLRRRLRPGARAGARVRATRRLDRRGRHTVGPARLVVGDPLGLATRTVEARCPQVVVLPRTEPILRQAGGGAAGNLARNGGGAAHETDLDGLRPYRAGAPASRIHWPAVARLGELVERRLAGAPESLPLIVLDACDPVTADALDRAVRAGASLCLALARAGGCRVLLPGDRRPGRLDPGLRGWTALHTRLALVEATATRPRVHASQVAGSLYWVTASQRVSMPAVGDGQFLVSAAGSNHGPVAFTVAGCQARRLRASRHREAA